MGGYKTRQASGKFHHIMRLYFYDTPNFHLSQDNNRGRFSFWELLISQVVPQEALTRLLVAKGNTSQEEANFRLLLAARYLIQDQLKFGSGSV